MDDYKAWLKDLGLDMPERRLDRLASKIARELEVRVGAVITDQLNDDQIAKFDAVFEEAARKQAEWLTENYPDYKRVLIAEKDKLHAELTKAKDPGILIKHWHQLKG